MAVVCRLDLRFSTWKSISSHLDFRCEVYWSTALTIISYTSHLNHKLVCDEALKFDIPNFDRFMVTGYSYKYKGITNHT